jgi:copper homeostasis protein (lipoprotein)
MSNDAFKTMAFERMTESIMHENEKTRNSHARRMAAIACAAVVTLIAGCNSASTGGVVSGSAAYREHPATPPASESGPLGELPASFEGDLPCADCEGIRYHLDLFEDGSFFYRLTYLGRDGAFDDIGTYSIGGDGTTLTLHGGREAHEMFRVVDAGTLRKLDLEGKPIESSLNYELRRAAAFSPIEPRLLMRGMYRYMADSALFDECLTGRRFPVAMEADNVALERAYLDAPHDPGEPVLVSLEGRLAQRPAMEGDASVLALVPTRFIGVWPGESCGARMTTVELAGVDWNLTRLGDVAVVVAEPRRQPSLTLTADGRVAGFDGCNRLAGSYQVTGRSIAFSQLASTKMACIDGMEHEAAFAAALEREASYRILGQHLELYSASGELLARFEAGTAP